MSTVVTIIMLALFFAGAGLLVEGRRWALVVAAAFALVAAISGVRGRHVGADNAARRG